MNIEYIRERVIIALANYCGTTKGQLAAFEEHAPADTSSKKRKRQHFIILDKSRVSADVDPVSCSETRSRVRPFPPIHEITFCSSSWRRALSALEEENSSWLRYCYGYDLSFDHQITICKFIWSEFERKLGARKVTAKKRARLSSLVWLAVQQYTTEETGRIGKFYYPGELAKLTGVSKTNWAENYASQWEELIDLCEDLDRSALRAISLKRSDARSKILTS